MKAIEALQKSNVVNQGSLVDVMDTIERAIEAGLYHCYYSKQLTEEIIENLIKDGYEASPQSAPPYYIYFYKISWKHAKAN